MLWRRARSRVRLRPSAHGLQACQLRRQAVAAETGGRDKDQTQMPGANEAGTPGDRGHSVEGAPANKHVSRASPEERLAGKTVVPYKTAAEVLNVGPRRIRQLVAKKQLISRGEGHQKKIDVASLRRRAGLQQTNPEQSGSKGK